jgi:serine/threonine protein kinase/tetratricopeptide (TPR) repeat protein
MRTLVRPAGDTPVPAVATALRQLSPFSIAEASSVERTAPVAAAPAASRSEEAVKSGPDSFREWLEEGSGFPKVGSEYLGFHLLEELGRGAFGRVYLARQGDLGGRPVALKVACDIFGESQTLAQLQHTNIVPIYSYHKAGLLQAACMPYYGRTTLGNVLATLIGRPSLPSSGRELKSTVNRASTLLSAKSGKAPAAAGPPPAPTPEPTAPLAAEGWARLEGLSYVGAVLWLGEQLADGLAHAHDRGIVHRDLKPANVLLTDEGRPMLLDFNLAEDTKLRGTAEAARIGGTLPYMAPEQLEAFRSSRGRLDARCDLFSLGVILYELLTGRHPFPIHRGPAHEVVPKMIADRRAAFAGIRQWNKEVSPAVEAIIGRCLAADPADRYQRADHLREDLDRQLKHLPLKHTPEPSARERLAKWARRHPKLTSSTAVAVAAGVLLIGLGGAAAFAVERSRDGHARAVFADHREAFRDAQVFHDDRNQSRPRLGESLDKLRNVLARYGVSEDGSGDLPADATARLSAADREQLRGDVGETFYMMAQVAYLSARTAAHRADREQHLRQAGAWHAAAERFAGDRLLRALLRQQADLAGLAGDTAESRRLRAEVERTPARSARDQVLLGHLLAQTRQPLLAIAHLRAATRLDPENLSGWYVRGTVHLDLGQPELAAECFAACAALRPTFAPAWMQRGIAYNHLHFYDLARDELDRAIEIDPKLAEAYVQRAIAWEGLRKPRESLADFGRAIASGAATPRLYFLRAEIKRRLGDAAGAEVDTREGFAGECRDALDWVKRSEARLELLDPLAGLGGAVVLRSVREAALADVEAALALNPESALALQQKAHILSEHFFDPDASLAVLDRLVKLHPDSAVAYSGRGVLLARAGKWEAAFRDAKAALERDNKAPILYQVAGIYALHSKSSPDDKREALRLLWGSLKTGFGLQFVDDDPELDPLRGDAEFRALVARAKRLREDLAR